MAELIEKLGIDWKLLIANSITFLIVLVVLRKYAWGPLMNVLDQRQKAVADSLSTAERIQTEAAALEAEKEKVLTAAKAQAQEIIASAKADGDLVRQRTISTAQFEADGILEKTREAMAQEKTQMVAEAKKELADLVIMAAEKVIESDLKDKVDAAMVKKAITEVEKARA